MQGICKLSFRSFMHVLICEVLVMKYYWLESINAVLRVLQLPWYDWTAAVVGCGLWVVNYDFTCVQGICKLSFRSFMHVLICKALVMKYYWLESINAVLRVLQLPWYDWTAPDVGCGPWVVNYDCTCMQGICKLSFRNFMCVAAHIYNFCVAARMYNFCVLQPACIIFVCCSTHV